MTGEGRGGEGRETEGRGVKGSEGGVKGEGGENAGEEGEGNEGGELGRERGGYFLSLTPSLPCPLNTPPIPTLSLHSNHCPWFQGSSII